MGFWKTVLIEGRPKFWDMPNARWKLGPFEDKALIEITGSQSAYDEVNSDPDTTELTRGEVEALSNAWGNSPWIYPVSSEVGYCSVPDLRERGITAEMATDEEIRTAIQSARAIIDGFCNRDFFRREARYFLDGNDTATVFLDDRPIIAVLTLKVDGEVMLPREYRVYSESGYISLVTGIFPEGKQNVEVYGQFGFAVIPSEVRQASIAIALGVLREMKSEIDLTKSTANSTRNAIGLKRAKIEDIEVEFEYPYSRGGQRLQTTGDGTVDAMLSKFKKDMDAGVI